MSPADPTLLSCLPDDFRGPGTTIAKVAAGMSGAGVYRVEAVGHAFALKISSESEPIEHWRRKVQLRQLAASAGLTPRVVHVDESRRAVLSAFVADRSFPAWLNQPSTRELALTRLARLLKRLHELPQPQPFERKEPREFLQALWAPLWAAYPLPKFVGELVRRALELTPPPAGPPVLSHNDVNPTNLLFDGENVLLLDWEASGPNEPLFDLATAAMFFRFDEPACLALLSAYEGHSVDALPPRFIYDRTLVSVLSGVAVLDSARKAGHPGAKGDEALESVSTLADFYQRLRGGAVDPGTPGGQWQFGLALLKNSLTL